MKRYIRSNSDDFDWVNRIYHLMNDWSFFDFPDDFPIAQTKKDVADGDVQKYIDYFNDVNALSLINMITLPVILCILFYKFS